jgi:uncharacterized membrane protein YpjA
MAAQTNSEVTGKPGWPVWLARFCVITGKEVWRMSTVWRALSTRRDFLWALFFVNFLGSVYGFWWYRNQLAETEVVWWPFIPDSPTASSLFTLALLAWIMKRTHPLLEALAAVTLFKYGIWAVVMIFWGGWLEPAPLMEALNWQHWMLIVSHLGMALEAVLFMHMTSFAWKHLLWVAAWTLTNDALDYGLDIHPWLSPYLEPYDHLVGWFTLLLSLTSLMLFATLSMLSAATRENSFRAG